LKVCTCILTRQTTELVCLHHCDEARSELKISGAHVDSGPNGHISNSKGGVVAEGLGHRRSSGWCGGDWFTYR
jgi:hypothetical protein